MKLQKDDETVAESQRRVLNAIQEGGLELLDILAKFQSNKAIFACISAPDRAKIMR